MSNEVDYSPIKYLGNGITIDFPFDWKVFNDTDLIVTLIDSEGNESTLELGIDYLVQIEAMGGNVKTTTPPLFGTKIIVSRKTPNYQSTGYSTSTGFQGTEIEKSFDKVSCNLQEMDYNIETFKTEFSSETNQKIEDNKDDTDRQIATNREEIDSQIADFETEVNSKIQQVNEAVQKLNRLDEVLEECEEYASGAASALENAQDEARIAGEKSEEAKGYSENAATTLETFRTEQQTAIQEIQQQQADSEQQMYLLQQMLVSQIQAAGIYMRDDRLFYKDTMGIEHEFRTDNGGIAPMSVKHRDIQKVENGFALTWTDPDDSVYKENVYCTWGKTVIVRKLNDYPENIYDGEIIYTNEIRNAHASTPFVDEVDNTLDYKYRAFPCSINGVYSYDNKNKFGVWLYGFIEDDDEQIPSKRITYIEDNEHFRPNIMNFSSDQFDYGDWKDSPFYSLEYIRPCMLYNASAVDGEGNSLNGQVMEYLDPNNLALTIDGQPSHVADQNCNANAMVEKRKIFTKKIFNGNKTTTLYSNVKLDDEFECYQCLREDGTYNEFYYTPIFSGALVNNKMVSLGGGLPALSGRTAQQEIDLARANGAGWDTEVWGDIEFEEDLFRMLFKHTDSQSVLGQGVTDSSNALSGSGVSGRAAAKGACYGTNTTNFPVKFRHRENFYSYQWCRFRGMIYINGVPYVKMTKHTGDGSTTNDYNTTGAGYIPLTQVPVTTGTNGGFISKTKATKYGKFSTVVSGSSSTHLCDGRWFNNSGTMYPYRGGVSGSGLSCGAFCLATNDAVSRAGWSLGAALSFKPL